MAQIKNVILLPVLLFICLLTSDADALIKILNVRHWVAPDHTRVVIDTSDGPDFIVEKSKEKILIDFKEATFPQAIPSQAILNKPGIKSISVLRLSQQIIRVEILLADHVDTSVFKLKKFEEKPDRVVVDIELPEVELRETREREEVKTQRKDRIIVIDPGHGGEDPGAIGWARTREKDVVLKISKKLRDILNKKEGYRAFLTRGGDYYVSFSKRLKIAREYGADLFLSIHADAARNRSARGMSIYCLSTSGASTEAAKLLAKKENLADIIGGTPNGDGKDESDPIVLNMFQTNTINVSKTYATSVLKNMKSVLSLKFSTVQGAPFRVLKLPEIPSLLVETAYISNKTEENLLRSSHYQTRIAESLVSAIVEFLPVEPAKKSAPPVYRTNNEDTKARAKVIPKGTDTDKNQPVAADKTVKPQEPKIVTYKVKKGDSLEKIARQYDMTLSSLLKLNNLKLHQPLYADRKIKIAVMGKNSEKSQSEPPEATRTMDKTGKAEDTASRQRAELTVYRVREGDSLDKIARRHDTTVSALLKLNKMKLNDSLHVGRMVKLKETDADREESSTRTATAKKMKKNRYTYYRVKKGETLDMIARRNSTTIQNLRQLNRMKPSDPLLANQKLKLPQNSSL
jgi:N-acetylmuramoyl-L-alanine amidase